jgi:hypothetical protein
LDWAGGGEGWVTAIDYPLQRVSYRLVAYYRWPLKAVTVLAFFFFFFFHIFTPSL